MRKLGLSAHIIYPGSQNQQVPQPRPTLGSVYLLMGLLPRLSTQWNATNRPGDGPALEPEPYSDLCTTVQQKARHDRPTIAQLCSPREVADEETKVQKNGN